MGRPPQHGWHAACEYAECHRADYVKRFITLPAFSSKRHRKDGYMFDQGCCSSQPAGGHSEVLRLTGDFDRANAAQLEEALDDAIDAGRAQLVVDLRDVTFLDSTILRMLIRGVSDAVAHGGQLALIRPNANVWRAFVLTGVSHAFPTFDRLDEALASFALP